MLGHKSLTALKRHINTPRRRQMAISAGIIAVAALTSASIFATGPNADPAPYVEKAWPVSITHVELQALQPNFAAFGRVESHRTAHLSADLVARVAAVEVKEGNWVTAGDVLVQLDPREARLRVLEREADLLEQESGLSSKRTQLVLEEQSAEHFRSRYEVAQAKLTRHQDLMQKRLISKALLDEVMSQANEASIEYRRHVRELSDLPNQIKAHQAGVARAQAQLEQANLDYDKTTIRAPFSGPILAVHVAPGDHSTLSAPLVSIADATGFEVRVQVPDDHTTAFRAAVGEGIEITALTEDGSRLTLTRLGNHIREGQTGLDAFFRGQQIDAIAAPAQTLGRVFNVTVEMPLQHDLIAVPVQSIYENNRIYTVQNQRLVGHRVQRVGEHESALHGYRVLIESPEIFAGDVIITTQLPKAITGLLVEVANEPDAVANDENPQGAHDEARALAKVAEAES